ncbi:MAG: GH3 auxin-responsive promoter family protein, partial [Acetobacteraceae bacterium]|nr:GH3 auxin-responsive promoter family protein [Acetobacteraceae bacterium]
RRAALDVLVHHLCNRRRSKVLAGRNFMLGGSTALREEASGVRSGDLSGIAAAGVPAWARAWYFPPPDLALMDDWERKIETLAPRSLQEDIRSISGTPSWLLLFFERLASLWPEKPRQLAQFYPHLELLVHGGISFAPYKERFASWLENSHAELREVYAASEGFIAIADRSPAEGMRVLLDTGLFFEFIPLNELDSNRPRRHWIGNAEVGHEYAIVLSTCAGLWGYVVGDVVRLVDRIPPRLLVTGRTSYFLSAFGEHVSAEELETALTAAAKAIGCGVSEFACGSLPVEETGAEGQHIFFVELTGAMPPNHVRETFAAICDGELSRLNDDYKAHRCGRQMLQPRIELLPPGSFNEWLRSRGRLGGQNKVPRVVTDPALLASLRARLKRG